MIDVGLLLTMAVAIGLPALVARWWHLATVDTSIGFFDVAVGPAFAGLAAGRFVAVAIDDPNALTSLSDLLIIRSGVEFWPGVVAALAVAAWGAHRAGVAVVDRWSDLTPLALVGYAAYEAGCLVRDGCFGPSAAVGLTPSGTATTMVPVGVLAAAAVAGGAVVLHREQRRRTSGLIVAGGVFVVAAVRSIGSVWLPHVGDGLTRQHWSSLVVAFASIVVAVGLGGRAPRPVTSR
ncbi:MAG: hypothetical protein CL424_12695 [Acidimicrobiaceae bacterium]|nr:hypothetical protein [Acidimicrobiaceae bacterium]